MPWNNNKIKYHTPSSSISTSSTSPPQRIGFKHVAVALFYLFVLLAVCGAIPILIIFTPKPELGPWYPKGIKCASCAEVEAENPILLDTVGCRGAREANSTMKVTFGGIERCWVRERGKDAWLRPMGWTREDMVRWAEEHK